MGLSFDAAWLHRIVGDELAYALARAHDSAANPHMADLALADQCFELVVAERQHLAHLLRRREVRKIING